MGRQGAARLPRDGQSSRNPALPGFCKSWPAGAIFPNGCRAAFGQTPVRTCLTVEATDLQEEATCLLPAPSDMFPEAADMFPAPSCLLPAPSDKFPAPADKFPLPGS